MLLQHRWQGCYGFYTRLMPKLQMTSGKAQVWKIRIQTKLL
jgi:hypothetical protein